MRTRLRSVLLVGDRYSHPGSGLKWMIQASHHSGRHLPIVLIIDDNPAIRDMVSWALELDGCEPAEAAEGQEALAWIDNAAREGRYPSVILLDLAMPGMDGTIFLEQLRSQWESIHPLPAIILITAASQTEEMSDADVKCVIVKPFHVRDLLDAVRRFTA